MDDGDVFIFIFEMMEIRVTPVHDKFQSFAFCYMSLLVYRSISPPLPYFDTSTFRCSAWLFQNRGRVQGMMIMYSVIFGER